MDAIYIGKDPSHVIKCVDSTTAAAMISQKHGIAYSADTIKKACQRGGIPGYIKFGRALFIPLEWVEGYTISNYKKKEKERIETLAKKMSKKSDM